MKLTHWKLGDAMNDDREALRLDYMRSQTGDLTSYAAMVGDSFTHRVDQLAQIIRDEHHESLGRYKEHLLRDVISRFLPRRFSIGTGFVAFPMRRTLATPDRTNSDHLNLYDHVVSKQVDLLIHDAVDYQPIFRDDDFVVVRPEAVRAIIEVKGSISKSEIEKSLDAFVDYGEKWRACRRFYAQFPNLPALRAPRMYVLGWRWYVRPDGRQEMSGETLREAITARYSRDALDVVGLPLLDAAMVYNDCVVGQMGWVGDSQELRFGYATTQGKLVRYDDRGQPQLAGDGTIAALMAGVSLGTTANFNFVFSYPNQTVTPTVFPHASAGMTSLVSGDAAKVVMDELGKARGGSSSVR